jgi:hypothetical protein
MMDSFSYQGISNGVAESYLHRHGNATWEQIERLLARHPPCPLLTNYWTYDNCRYDKTSRCCSEPEHLGGCPVPTHRLRNGRLNQTAYSLYFFIRDIARRDLPAWIDSQLSTISDGAPNRHQLMQEALVGPMRHIYGVSDKVVTMTLSSVLIAAPDIKPNWFEAGSQMVVVDTLVHNFLHRTGILQRFGVGHAYGPACYRQGHCADVLRLVAASIDARRFNKRYSSDGRWRDPSDTDRSWVKSRGGHCALTLNRRVLTRRANRRQSDVWLTRESRFPLGDLQPVKFPSLPK